MSMSFLSSTLPPSGSGQSLSNTFQNFIWWPHQVSPEGVCNDHIWAFFLSYHLDWYNLVTILWNPTTFQVLSTITCIYSQKYKGINTKLCGYGFSILGLIPTTSASKDAMHSSFITIRGEYVIDVLIQQTIICQVLEWNCCSLEAFLNINPKQWRKATKLMTIYCSMHQLTKKKGEIFYFSTIILELSTSMVLFCQMSPKR